MTTIPTLNPDLDLLLEREVEVSPEDVWAAWTRPEQVVKWFTPAPWQTVDCQIDLRPGGAFRTVMRSPEGEDFPNVGCYLEVVPNERLVWTSALAPGYRPLTEAAGEFLFTAVISLERTPKGTRYRALAIHPDAETCERHDAMGFQDGWGAALAQLVDMVKGNTAGR
jgi:uncharacterized protein YndB with AHSA1/START domain